MKLKPKPKPRPKGKPKPRPKPIPETEEEAPEEAREVGVGDTGKEGKMKKDTKLNDEPFTLRFTGDGKTIVFSSIDQIRLAAVAEDFLKSNNIKFDRTEIGGDAANGDDTGNAHE